MEFKGTKGNWEIIKVSHTDLETNVICGETRIAQVKHYNIGMDDWTKNDPTYKCGLSNAKLISAAPDLLRALQIVERQSGITWDSKKGKDSEVGAMLHIINKAISKALEGDVTND